MAAAVLSVKNLNVVYGLHYAVKDLSFELHEGDVCALVGPNGAGKTSTIRAIAGLQPTMHGHIEICGEKWEDGGRELTRHFGYMSDFFPVPDRLRVWEFLDHFALAFEVENRKERIREVLELVRLPEKFSSDCSELSRGMKQRLMVAKTLLHDPQFLVLDEPASGLDPMGRIELKNIFLELASRGKTILVSSHILTELAGFCNTIAIMEKAKLTQFGPIDGIGEDSESQSVTVRWGQSPANIEILLSSLSGVEGAEVGKNEAKFRVFHNTLDPQIVLKKLIENNVEIIEWRVGGGNLEQIYMKSGAKELS